MSLQRSFTILGDSNVSQNMTALNRRASPLMEDCQVLSCRKLASFSDCLRTMRSASNSCIISCLTNFITDISSRRSTSASISARVEPVLDDIRAILTEFSAANPDVMFFISPPMYRRKPEWYRHGLSEILVQFSKSLAGLLTPSFHLLPSFGFPDLEDDGVHLTPYAGLKFVVHLFDSSLDLIKASGAPIPVGVAKLQETSRVLEDRVVILEQGQRHLRQELQMKTAIDAELADYEENVRNECFFVLSGLEPVPSDLVGRDWQNFAKDLVQSKIKLILGRESKIVVVSGLRRDAKPIYLVKLESVDDSKRIRDKFGSSFKAGATPLPDNLKGLSIRIRLTHATRVRIAIMQVLAGHYKKSNPGSRTQVVNFEPRPMLRLTPPPGASDPRVLSFTFIEAVTKLPIKFSRKDYAFIMKTVSGKFKGQLRSLFVVISDDERDFGHRRQDSESSAGSSSSSGSESDTGDVGDSRDTRGRQPERVSDTSTRARNESLTRDRGSAPVPHTSTQAPPTSGRGSKRGAPTAKGGPHKSHRR